MASATGIQSFRATIGVPPSTASPSDSILIIIDAQNEYLRGLLKTVNSTSTHAAIKTLLSAWRSAGKSESVVHVLHQVPDGAPVFTPGADVSREMAGLEPQTGEKVITKQHPSSFAGTALDAYLKERGAKKVVLCGYMAHVCVSTTARVAAELGYDVILAEDAIGDRDIPGVGGAEVTKIALLELADAFGTVMPSAQIV